MIRADNIPIAVNGVRCDAGAKGHWPNQSNRGLQIPNEYSVLLLLMSHFDLMGMAIKTCLEYIKNLSRISSYFCIRQV